MSRSSGRSSSGRSSSGRSSSASSSSNALADSLFDNIAEARKTPSPKLAELVGEDTTFPDALMPGAGEFPSGLLTDAEDTVVENEDEEEEEDEENPNNISMLTSQGQEVVVVSADDEDEDNRTLDDVLLGLAITPRTIMKSKAMVTADSDLSSKGLQDSPETAPESPGAFFSDGSVLTGDVDLDSDGHLTSMPIIPSFRRFLMSRKRRRRFYTCLAILAVAILAAVVVAVLFTATDLFAPSSSSQSSNVAGSQADTGPTFTPTLRPTARPTITPQPTTSPSVSPSGAPTTTKAPTDTPSVSPSMVPSASPSKGPTGVPSASPSNIPTFTPSQGPSNMPSQSPTMPLSPLELAVYAVTPASIFRNETTPQYLAMQWMQANEAGYTYDYSRPDKIRQRYAILTMSYSLNSDGYNGVIGPRFVNNSNVDECQWQGITCHVNTTLVDKIVWSNVSLTGVIPDEVKALKNMTTLDLGENSIAGSIPDGLYELSNLQYLYLHDNQLSGNISESIANMSSLVNFYAGSNNLGGPIPKGLGSPKSGGDNVRPLRYISLLRNQISGPIPEKLNLREMVYLDLGYNQITGTFPTDWVEGVDSMSRIRHLYLDNNMMTGQLPSDLQSIGMGRLETLQLNNNRFTGVVPGNFEISTSLQQMELQDNFFSGLDTSVCSLIVFLGGELVNFRADCEICNCQYFCGSDECY